VGTGSLSKKTRQKLSGILPGRWSAGLRIESFGKGRCVWLDWGTNEADGHFLAGNLLAHLPDGYSFVSVFLLSEGGDSRVLTVPAYRAAVAPEAPCRPKRVRSPP
jgi:hypothetical protein